MTRSVDELIRALRSAVVRMERTNKSHYTYEMRVAEVEAVEAALLAALTPPPPSQDDVALVDQFEQDADMFDFVTLRADATFDEKNAAWKKYQASKAKILSRLSLRADRDAVIEECARAADTYIVEGLETVNSVKREIASSIRTLKTKEPTNG